MDESKAEAMAASKRRRNRRMGEESENKQRARGGGREGWGWGGTRKKLWSCKEVVRLFFCEFREKRLTTRITRSGSDEYISLDVVLVAEWAKYLVMGDDGLMSS